MAVGPTRTVGPIGTAHYKPDLVIINCDISRIEKPFFIWDYLTKLYPDKDKIELFARFDDYLFKQELIDKGWDFWRNEA